MRLTLTLAAGILLMGFASQAEPDPVKLQQCIQSCQSFRSEPEYVIKRCVSRCQSEYGPRLSRINMMSETAESSCDSSTETVSEEI